MFQLILIAVRNLLQHRKRTLMLGGAIAGVTMLLVVLLGLSNGMRATMFRSATTLMTGHVNVAGFYKVTSGSSAPLVNDYPKIMGIVKKEIPEVAYMTQRGRGWGKVISDRGALQAGLGGIDITSETGFKEVVQLREGNLDGLKEPNTLMLFKKQADKLEVKVGDSLTISAPTPRGVNNTIDVRVVAIAEGIGLLSSWNVYVPNATLHALYTTSPTTTGAIHLYLKDVRALGTVQQKVRDVLSKAGYILMDDDPKMFWMKFEVVNREDWIGQKLDITNWEAEVSFLKWVITALDGLTGALVFVLLVIIAVGIMNTLWIAIRERTREIGTLRAIGMQRARVLAMFVLEAFLLSVAATAFGALLGIGICAGVNAANITVPFDLQLFLMSSTLVLQVVPSAVIGSIALITVCTTLISLIPSFIAARMRPVTAMHHMG